jgi:hypothetical protein
MRIGEHPKLESFRFVRPGGVGLLLTFAHLLGSFDNRIDAYNLEWTRC